uniref:Methyltransferase domain-containing protein n=1 Tax=Panagrolaimus sp. PS1159 TaxID=55785 RepID=A0AC35GB76_9BILA
MGLRHSNERLTTIIIVLCFYIVFSCFREGSTYYPTRKRTQKVDDLIINEYQKQSELRKRFLKKYIKPKGYGTLYNALVPEVFCKDLIRIGRVGDGGKWICNPTAMLNWPKCNIYSLGTYNDPSFEEDFQTFLSNKCKLRCVDKDEQNPDTIKRIEDVNGVFKKAFIGSKTNASENMLKFSNLLSEFRDRRIDILKIDIEGGEFDIIDELVSVPMCQILIEVHGKTAEQTLELLQALSKNGFYLFSYEVNGFWHELSEYSFIHEKCFTLFNIQTVYGKFLS